MSGQGLAGAASNANVSITCDSVTVHNDVTQMFRDDSPVDKGQFAVGVCEYPKSKRPQYAKELREQQEKATTPLKLKFGLLSHLLFGKYSSEDENYDTKESQDTIIGIVHQVTELKLLLVTHDMLNTVIIPRLVDQLNAKPYEKWNFSS